MEAGLGDGASVWQEKKLANQIAKDFDVLIYDRAGYGKSGIGSAPRTVRQIRQELETVIDQMANGRKVILIGHSFGGLIIRDYAIHNPTRTAALLFIDSSHERYNFPLSKEKEDLLYTLLSAQFGVNHGSSREARELNNSLTYMLTLGNLPDVPVVVLTSMRKDAENLSADEFNDKTRQDWYNAHHSLKNGVSNFTHLQTQKSGHYIMREEPELVLSSLSILKTKLP
jgi:pimeloyl-ACP methyl ester carboxylesterase